MTAATVLLGQAEEALVLCDFCSAENRARDCLQQAAYLPGDAVGIQDRACVVLVQAVYETQRFASARKLLRDCFGSLERAPPHTLLLWLALALDTDCRSEAQNIILSALDTRQPGGAAGWTRRQYLALLHLYVFEVLLPELRDATEVMRWVEETELPVSGEERQLLLEELEQHQQLALPRASSSSVAAAAAAAGRDCLAGVRQEAAAAAAAEQLGYDEVDDGFSFEQHQEQQQQQQQLRRQQQQHQAPRSAAAGAQQQRRQRRQQQQGASSSKLAGVQPLSEIQPDTGEGDIEAAAAAGAAEPLSLGAGLEWLGRCQQQVLQAAAAVYGPLLGLPPLAAQQQRGRLAAAAAGSQQGGLAAGSDPAASLQLLTGTVLGVVLLYAAYAERRAIKTGVSRARHSAWAALADLLRMAFSLSVNPMAAPR